MAEASLQALPVFIPSGTFFPKFSMRVSKFSNPPTAGFLSPRALLTISPVKWAQSHNVSLPLHWDHPLTLLHPYLKLHTPVSVIAHVFNDFLHLLLYLSVSIFSFCTFTECIGICTFPLPLVILSSIKNVYFANAYLPVFNSPISNHISLQIHQN